MALAFRNPSPDADGALLIRPSWRSLGRWERHLAGLLALGGAVVLVRLYGRRPAFEMFGTSIRVTADAILVTHWFRSTATVPMRDIARVVRCAVWYRSQANTKPTVFAFSPTGRCVLSLYAFRWDAADPGPDLATGRDCSGRLLGRRHHG